MILLVVKRITKVIEKSDMAKFWALGFAACHKQELFVAQELINNVKLKCCGIYVNEENCVFIFGMCVCCYGSCRILHRNFSTPNECFYKKML